MPMFFSTQYALGASTITPQSENYEPIPKLEPLAVADDYLQFGGTASLLLFLGTVFSGDINSFSLYVRIVETSTNSVVTESYFGGANGLSSVVMLSAAYQIAPNAKPAFVAQWKLLGSPGMVIEGPTTLSFSATVFENIS